MLTGALVRYLGAGVVLALVAGLLWFRSEAHDARAAAAVYREAAEESARTLKAKAADDKLAAQLVGDYAADIARLQEEARNARTSIATAPITNGCGDSPAVRRLLDGLP
jgi:hypothetical protein